MVAGTHSWGAQPAETGVLTKGHVSPGAGPGDCVGLTPHMGQDPVPGDPVSAQCVLSPWTFPTSELRVLPWLTCVPFSSLHLVAFIWGQAPLGGLLLCIMLSENLWWCHISIIAYPISNQRDNHCLLSSRLNSGNLICYFILEQSWFLLFCLF